MTNLLMISLHFLRFMKLKLTVFSRPLKKAVLMAFWTKAGLCVKSSLLEQSLPRTPGRQIRSLPTYQVGLRNLRLIKELRPCKTLYICRVSITDVVSALQIHPFLTNKANFQKSQVNVNIVSTREYEQMDTWSHRKKQSQTNPIQTQFKANLSRRSLWQSRIKPNHPPESRKLPIKASFVKEENINVYKKQRQPNFFEVKSLHSMKKYQPIPIVDFLQHMVLTLIRIVFRKVRIKLKIYTQDSSFGLILNTRNKAGKMYILGRLGMIFALI
jgi:hypothetical protein